MRIATESVKERIWSIDIARFYAMAMVYYGHFVERFMLLKNPAGFAHYKFIYSFHMMFFFVLAGFVARENDMDFGFGRYLKHRVISRLLPFVFFTVIFMVTPVFFTGEFYGMVLPSIEGYRKGLINTVFGIPSFCIPSWFILMMFTVELLHFGAFRFLKSNTRILAGVFAFYVVGYWLNLKLDLFNPLKGRVVGWNYLFIHEAITMYSFYLLGIYLRRKKFLMGRVSRKILIPGVIVTFLAVLFTYKLNTGPFNFHVYNAVVILFSSHGHFFWFFVTAAAGSFMILFLAKITPSRKMIIWLGQNTLILMCLNGIFYHYINGPVAKWILESLAGSGLTVFWVGFLMTMASLAACAPLIYLFNKFIPQLVGKPKINGPLLKNFLSA
ncbi:MAG: acyltransferase family protein [Desulfosarcinaceae bacterium]